MLVNNTTCATAEAVLTDPAGREVLVLVAKAGYRWGQGADLEPLQPSPAVVAADQYTGAPATSGLLTAGEVSLPKPRVDVLVRGEIVLAAPFEQIDCTLEIGHRFVKTLRVFGDRHWRHGAGSAMVPSRARPFVRMPIDWQRSAGGTDPEDPGHLDLRNPVGRGLRRRVAALEGHPVPNFEDPRAPILDAQQIGEPVGWGPIAPYWQPRRALAGTYDERWQAERFPLLPADFDSGFLNVAPRDQQLDHYPAGVEVQLTGFTPRRRERFVLPEMAPPVTVVEGSTMHQVASQVDTIIIDPMEQSLLLVARAVYRPRNVEALALAFLGPLSDEQRLALRRGRPLSAQRA